MSSLVKSVGTIGALTAVSRVFGFVRDMLLSRVLGAGLAADAWQLAFTLPNTFRRLFAEGAFSVAFVPMYARRLHGEDGGEDAADAFAGDVLSVFVWVLLAFSALAMIVMPGIVWLLAREYAAVPGKFELSVALSRMTFPYLGLVSLVAMLSGVLNARSRFAPGAFVPVFLNIVMISGIVTGWYLRGPGGDDTVVAWALAISLTISGVVQLVYMGWASRRAGVRLKVSAPRFTPDVRRLGRLILPATFGAGIYQISQLVDTFFATSLPQGSLTLLKMADRLNQMPLGIFGIALGTAILPMLARHIQTGDAAEAQRLQASAVEVGTLLTFPAAVALAICAPAFVTAFFVGGKMTAANGALMADIVVALVCGLPAYVMVKVFQPAFFSREDTRTPVWTAAGVLAVNIALNFWVVPRYGIVGLAAATAVCATLNVVALSAILQRRGWFRMTARLAGRIARQIAACAVMGAFLWWLMPQLAGWYAGSVIERALSLGMLVAGGMAVFFAAALVLGALDKDLLAQLRRRRPPDPWTLQSKNPMRVVSGIQPTGNLHLGNYLGAIRNWVRMQDEVTGADAQGTGQCLFFLADLHAISMPHDPAELRRATLEMAAALVACGIDPDRAILFNQAQVPAHAELQWLLNGTARMGWLNRMTQFKDKSGKNREGASAALFTYPVLQAADVLLYQATHVPVGEDQKQHLELARDIAQKFNNDFGDTFTLPAPISPPEAARIMSLRDGAKKMSKSDPSEMSRIELADAPDVVMQKVKKAKTDAEPLPSEAAGLEGRPEALNLVTIYAALAGSSVDGVLGEFGGQGFGTFKPALGTLLVETLRPISARFTQLLGDRDALDAILARGAAKARELGRPTLDATYDALGLVRG